MIENVQAPKAKISPNDQLEKLLEIHKQEAEKARAEMEGIKTALRAMQKKNPEKEVQKEKISTETQITAKNSIS